MIELFFSPTPNAWKISVALAEMALDYRMIHLDLHKGDQFSDWYKTINPNCKIPAIIDHCPEDSGEPIVVFESAAILLYLAEKSGRFLPACSRRRHEVVQWLFWQVGGLGPMLGQHGHFLLYADEPQPYSLERYRKEALRLYGVMDARLSDREFLCEEYSIADMACWPWVLTHRRQEIDLSEFPNVRRWYEHLKTRPAVRRGYDAGRAGEE